ncbi:hypothetical protein Dda_9065 [Drechslerella dactyloides]|uniref:Uncharacterized protein n=1 Tax=Drechslerella dactyloides TaxID=74499 RepID=A0AAD6IRI9_DREDA|nr:hypothetical protein Dda_9065 [Drechslerella dactyloides]
MDKPYIISTDNHHDLLAKYTVAQEIRKAMRVSVSGDHHVNHPKPYRRALKTFDKPMTGSGPETGN